MSKTIIDLMRHGEPVGGRRYRGQTDDPLSEKGWQQMWDAAGEFRGWQHIVTSPLQRCAAFADALQVSYGISDKNVFVKKFERSTGNGVWQAIVNTFIPDAGYTRFDTNGLSVNYIPHVPG